MTPEPSSLRWVRQAIDRIDDALLLLLAGRLRLARHAGRCKRAAGMPLRDPVREARVQARADALARRIGVPASVAHGVIRGAIDDACRTQGLAADVDQGPGGTTAGMIVADMPASDLHAAVDPSPNASRWLRLLPPPARLAPWLRALPPALQRRLLERAIARVLATPLATGALDFMHGRRLGIDISDLDLHWVIEGRDGRLHAVDAVPEASVRGTATDLLLLASRLEDADTLFFQRRLVLTGDTELGLTARNLLERLPWESVPLALRIVLNRGARVARAARSAHRGE